MEEREPLDLTKLPYSFDPATYCVVPLHALHKILCDLTIKLPKIKFVATGRCFRNNTSYVDEVRVFNDGEKVGKLVMQQEYADGKTHDIYNIHSDRIHNQRGKRNCKHSRIYKKALGIAVDAFAPIENKKIADDITGSAKYLVTKMAQNARSHLQQVLRGKEVEVLQYMKQVEDVEPTRVPPELLREMIDWRDKLTNHQVAASVLNAMDACTGMVVKLTPSGVMTMVELTIPNVAKRIESSYDLPLEYQEKFTILKIMDKNQPIVGVGAKVEEGEDDFFYMTAGAMQTTC